MRNHYTFRKEHTTHAASHQVNPVFQKFIHDQSVHSIASCTQFAKQLPSHSSEIFSEEVYALLPIRTESKQLQTLIIYKNHVRLIDQHPLKCINTFLTQKHFLSYIPYCKTISHFFKKPIYKIPVATLNNVLFPIETPTRYRSTIWINPAQITGIHTDKLTTFITLSNNFSIASPIQKRALQKLIRRSFIVLGIIHQEFIIPEEFLSQIPLSSYLGIHLNPLLSEIFSKLLPIDYVFAKWNFSQSYQETIEKEYLKHYEEEQNISLK